MTALMWQVIIAVSIVVAFFIKYSSKSDPNNSTTKIKANAPLLAIAGWAAWTITVLLGPLMNFQLTLIFLVAGLCIFIYRSILSRDTKVDTLTAALADAKNIYNDNFDEALVRERAKQQAERDFVSRIHPIDGVQHLKSEMQQALGDAQTRALIMSG